jgi:hypothetical protein
VTNHMMTDFPNQKFHETGASYRSGFPATPGLLLINGCLLKLTGLIPFRFPSGSTTLAASDLWPATISVGTSPSTAKTASGAVPSGGRRSTAALDRAVLARARPRLRHDRCRCVDREVCLP